jgi:hypothetical protein
LAGGAAGSLPYQSGAGITAMLAAGSNGQVLTLASGVPSWATPTTGTVTSVSGTGTVSGISLSGTVTSTGNLTLGGALNLSSPPAIGGTTPAAISGTTITATTKFVGPYFDAATSAGGALRNSSGTAQLQWGAGGGNNVSLDVATNINPANAAVSISPTGTGTVAISPAGALTINPTTASTMNNVAIGASTAAAGTFTNLNVTGTIALAGSTGTAGYVLTSNGASAPTWQVNASGLAIVDDTTTNATRYLTFTSATTGNITTGNVSSTKLQFNPSTGVFTATSFSGAGTGLTGTASSLSIGGTATTATTANATNTSNNFQMNSLGVGTAGSGTAGEIRATNNVTAYYSSDKKFKENVRDIENALSIVEVIGGKEFDWTDAYIEEKGGEDGYFVQKADFGVIAQDVQSVFPKAVRARDDGSLAVDYAKLAALAFAAIVELNEKLKQLKVK